MRNPWKKGRVYENSLSQSGYGRKQPGSGNRWMAKEDIKGENLFSRLLIQAKNASGQKSYSLKLEDLQTLRFNASKVGRVGIIMVNYGDNKEYVVMRKEDFDYYFKGEPDDKTEGEESDN